MNKWKEIIIDSEHKVLIKKSVKYNLGFITLYDYMITDLKNNEKIPGHVNLFQSVEKCFCPQNILGTVYDNCLKRYFDNNGCFDVQKFLDDNILPRKIIDFICQEEGL